VHWISAAPSALLPPLTSDALPLPTHTMVWQPSPVDWDAHSWIGLPLPVHWITLAQAADLRILLGLLEAEVQASQEPRFGQPGFEQVPIAPCTSTHIVHVRSPAGKERIRDLPRTAPDPGGS